MSCISCIKWRSLLPPRYNYFGAEHATNPEAPPPLYPNAPTNVPFWPSASHLHSPTPHPSNPKPLLSPPPQPPSLTARLTMPTKVWPFRISSRPWCALSSTSCSSSCTLLSSLSVADGSMPDSATAVPAGAPGVDSSAAALATCGRASEERSSGSAAELPLRRATEPDGAGAGEVRRGQSKEGYMLQGHWVGIKRYCMV